MTKSSKRTNGDGDSGTSITVAKLALLAAVISALVSGPLTAGLTYLFTGPTANKAVADAINTAESKIKLEYAAGEATDNSLGLFPGEIRAFAFGGTKDMSVAVKHLRDKGWLECAGQGIKESEFKRLYAILSEANFPWGKKVDDGGHVSARVPDLRGVFLRGWMNGRGEPGRGDPGDQRVPSDLEGNGAAGNNVGSFQPDQLHDHQHTIDRRASNNASNLDTMYVAGGEGGGMHNPDSTGSVLAGAGSESRPKNVYVMYCIYTGTTIPSDMADGSIKEGLRR